MATQLIDIPANTNTEITALLSGVSGALFFTHTGEKDLWVSKNTPMTGSGQGHPVCLGESWEFNESDDVYVWTERRFTMPVSEVK